MTALTRTRIDSETNIASIAAARESMFATSEASMAPTISATESQTAILNNEQRIQTLQLQAISDNLMMVGRILQAQTHINDVSGLALARNNF